MNRMLAITLTLAVLFASRITAQTFWEPANTGLYGANIHALELDDRGIGLAATQIGIFRSTDDGRTWSFADSLYATCFATAPDGRIFAGTQAGLYRSNDAGAHWHNVQPGTVATMIAAGKLGEVYASSGIEFYRSPDGGEIWEKMNGYTPSRFYDLVIAPNGDIYAPAKEGLYRSTDNGVSWNNIWPIIRPSKSVYAVAVSQEGDIYAAAEQMVYRSTDLGKKWTAVADLKVARLAVDGVGIVYAAAIDDAEGRSMMNGLFRSLDKGVTWERVALSHAYALNIARNGDVLIHADQNLYRSANRGDTWKPSNHGLTNTSFDFVAADSLGNVYAMRAGSISPQHYHALYRTSDNGTSWHLLRDSLTDGMRVALPNGHLFMEVIDSLKPSVVHGLLHSSDAGVTWEHFGRNPTVFASRPEGSIVIGYAERDPLGKVTRGSAAVSADSGTGWNRWEFPDGGPISAGLMPGGIALAGIGRGAATSFAEASLQRSADAGRSWQQVRPSTVVRSFLVVDSAVMLAVGYDLVTGSSGGTARTPGRIYRSDDTGMTWTMAKDSVDVSWIGLETSGFIGMQTEQGFFRSTDKGATWRTDYPAGGIVRLTPMRDGIIYGRGPEGIYRSYDGGTTWRLEDDGLPQGRSFKKYQFAMNSGGWFFAGTLGNGIFRSARSSGVVRSYAPTPASMRLHGCWPNPVRSHATIAFSLERATRITLHITDMLGRAVQTPLDEHLEPGDHAVDFQTGSLPAGTYFYALRGEDEAMGGMVVVEE